MPTLLANFEERGVQPDVRVLLGQATVPESLDFRIELLAQPRDLALADHGHPQRFHQIVHPAGGNPLDVGFLDYPYQGPFRTPPELQQAREERPVSNPGNLQFDGSHPGIPLAGTIALPLPRAFGGPLVLLRPKMLGNLKIHQRLPQYPDALPQKIHLARHLRLAQQIRQCHPEVVGHRCGVLLLSVSLARSRKEENHAVADLINHQPNTDLHTHGDSNERD